MIKKHENHVFTWLKNKHHPLWAEMFMTSEILTSPSGWLQKNAKTTRTLRGRVCRTAEKHNFGPGVATVRLLSHLGVPVSEGQKQELQREQRRHTRQKAYNKDPVNTRRRYRRDSKTRLQRLAWKSRSDYQPSDYSKGHLDHPYPVLVILGSFYFYSSK